MTTISIKEEYFKKPIKEIKSELLYFTRIFKENYMTLDIETVEHFEQMIKILSEILLVKMKARVLPTNPEQKVIEIHFNPEEKGNLTKKLGTLRNFGNKNKLVKNHKIEDLRNLNLIYDMYILDTFSKSVLHLYCVELKIIGISKKNKGELINELLYYVKFNLNDNDNDNYEN